MVVPCAKAQNIQSQNIPLQKMDEESHRDVCCTESVVNYVLALQWACSEIIIRVKSGINELYAINSSTFRILDSFLYFIKSFGPLGGDGSEYIIVERTEKSKVCVDVKMMKGVIGRTINSNMIECRKFKTSESCLF